MAEVMVMAKKKDTDDALGVLIFIILVLAALVYLLIKRRVIFLIILILGIVICIINIYMKSNEKNGIKKNEGSNSVNKNLGKINLKSEKVDNFLSTRKKDYKYDKKLEKKMNDYGLEDWQKDLVRKRRIRALEF
jgi:hypothetical protein